MAGFWDRVLGPRVPSEEAVKHRERYRRPFLLFALAAVLLLISIVFPYWRLYLRAPQYPEGLTVQAFVNRLEGDVAELEGLNHYVGLPSFEDGAVLERSVSVIAIIVLAGLVFAGFYIHSRYVLLLTLPALLFPFIFLADLQYWLWRYGHDLDPRAPLANAVGEFTPHLFGPSEIAQFETTAWPGIGLVLAFVASGLVAAGLWFHRKAYKPLVEELEAEEAEEAVEAEPPTSGVPAG
ncbi:MAG: cytochrome C [Acidimicrobiia bacterium]|nr:cytochrome C [Acidimicrobiia bacterium]